jgi:hypothetical protein
MSFKLPKIGQLFKKGDAKKRALMIIITAVVLIFVVVVIGRYIQIKTSDMSAASVKTTPNIDSLQGGHLTPEYQATLEASNNKRAQNAKDNGTSAISTIINSGQSDAVATSGCTECCAGCGDETVDQNLNSLLKDGEISSSVADLLNRLAGEGMSPADYAAQLQDLVRQNKLAADQARALMDAYQSQYKDAIAKAGADALDALIKSGKLPIDAANTLLADQERGLTPAQYQAELQRLANAGKIAADAAKALAAKYAQQMADRLAAETAAQLAGMVAAGQLAADKANALKALQANNSPIDDYAQTLARMADANDLSNALAKQLLDQYKKQHGISGDDAGLGMYSNTPELSQEDGEKLQALQNQGVSVEEFAAQLQAFVSADSISTQVAGDLLNKYQTEYNAKQTFTKDLENASAQGGVSASALSQINQWVSEKTAQSDFSTQIQLLADQGQVTNDSVSGIVSDYSIYRDAADVKDSQIEKYETQMRVPADVAAQLEKLQNAKAALSDYAAMLQRLADAAVISSETAQGLLASYRDKLSQQSGQGNLDFSSPAIESSFGTTSTGNDNLDRIQQQVAQQQAQSNNNRYSMQSSMQGTTSLNGPQVTQDQRVAQLASAMSGQALKIYTSMTTTVPQKPVRAANDGASGVDGSSLEGGGASATEANAGPPIIKAGAILYAVLDTAVDSDYPDSPVMATVVAGKFKGAKLLGGIKTVKNGQRVMLEFNLINMDKWVTGKSVDAFAIDPSTARSAVATSVNNHYMLRYGTLFASSFMQGLGEAIEESGTTVSSDDGVVTSSSEDLDTEETILVALGQVGETAGEEVSKLTDTPPTVRVKSGVGIGVLFMADVTEDASGVQSQSEGQDQQSGQQGASASGQQKQSES